MPNIESGCYHHPAFKFSDRPMFPVSGGVQVEMAALQYRSSRLVRGLDAKTGERKGFGEDGRTEVVSAR